MSEKQCEAEYRDTVHRRTFQCFRKAGFGKYGNYCEQHSKRQEPEQARALAAEHGVEGERE